MVCALVAATSVSVRSSGCSTAAIRLVATRDRIQGAPPIFEVPREKECDGGTHK